MLDRLEHVAAVIRFDDNRRAPAQPFRNQRRYVTKIEQRRDLHSVVRGRESKIVDRIMRHGKRMKLDLSDLKVAAGIDLDSTIAQSVGALSGLVVRDPDASGFANVGVSRLGRNEYRAIEISYQHPQAATMIAMFVRNQNAVER